jgi:hypothetical protein
MKVFIFPYQEKNQEKLIGSIFSQDIKNASFICLDSSLYNLCNSFDNKDFIKIELPKLPNFEKFLILKDYVDLIGAIADYNKGVKEWWASDISSKNRTLSPMQSILNGIVFSTKAINKCSQNSRDLYIFGASWPVVEFIEEYSFTKGIETHIDSYFFSILLRRCKYFFEKQVYLFKSIISSVVNVIRSHHSFGRIYKIDKSKPVFLIKSFIFPSSFSQEDGYKDLFFTDLESYLKEKIPEDAQVLTISQGFSGRYKLYRDMRRVRDKVVMPVEAFLNVIEIFFAGISFFKFLVFAPIKVPKYINFMGSNISSTMKELVGTYGNSILFGDYLYYYLARRIAKTYNLQTCYMTYEGNHWERMFVKGLKEVRPNMEIIGYQHAAIPQSAAGSFISCKEVEIIPHPDKIITTGEKVTEILHQNSCFPQDRIQSGCALRYQYLYELIKFPIKKVSPDTYTILVVLGDIDSSGILLYAINQANLLSNVSFIIRAHPILTLEKLLNISNIKIEDLPKNMLISHLDHVKSDIQRCDTMLYWSSTVAIEALMMGKSLICFDREDVLSFDPMSLISFNDLKWTVNSNESIVSAVDEIVNMEHDELIKRVLKGRKYIEEYFSEKGEKNMQSFLPKIYKV